MIGDIRRHHEGFPAESLALGRRRLERFLTPTCEHDRVASLHQPERRRPADAAARARHERDLFL